MHDRVPAWGLWFCTWEDRGSPPRGEDAERVGVLGAEHGPHGGADAGHGLEVHPGPVPAILRGLGGGGSGC